MSRGTKCSSSSKERKELGNRGAVEGRGRRDGGRVRVWVWDREKGGGEIDERRSYLCGVEGRGGVGSREGILRWLRCG